MQANSFAPVWVPAQQALSEKGSTLKGKEYSHWEQMCPFRVDLFSKMRHRQFQMVISPEDVFIPINLRKVNTIHPLFLVRRVPT